MIRQLRLLATGAILVAGTAAVTLSATADAAPRAGAALTLYTNVVSSRWKCNLYARVDGSPRFACSVAGKSLLLNPGTYLITPGLQQVTTHTTESCSSSKANGVSYLSKSVNDLNEALIRVSVPTTMRFFCSPFRTGITFSGALETFIATPVSDQN
jgi:hypothetical protein